ncbi:hypothetical protein [Oerskovia sp. USHLN155]
MDEVDGLGRSDVADAICDLASYPCVAAATCLAAVAWRNQGRMLKKNRLRVAVAFGVALALAGGVSSASAIGRATAMCPKSNSSSFAGYTNASYGESFQSFDGACGSVGLRVKYSRDGVPGYVTSQKWGSQIVTYQLSGTVGGIHTVGYDKKVEKTIYT